MIAALHSLGVDIAQRHTATRYKLLFEAVFAVHIVLVVDERVHQFVETLLCQFAPALRWVQTALLDEVGPKAAVELLRIYRRQLFGRILWDEVRYYI